MSDPTTHHGIPIHGLTLEKLARLSPPGPPYNVTTYGAVGDGTTDDTAAIQAALDAAGSTGTIVIPPATYKHAGLNVPAGRTTRITAHGATITYTGSGIALDVQGTSGSRSGLDVRGGTWKGANAGTGFKLAFCTKLLYFEGVTVEDFNDGLHVTETHSGDFYLLKVQGCVRYGVYLDGESVFTIGAVNNVFRRLQVLVCDKGVRMEGSAGGNYFDRSELSANATRECELIGTATRNPSGVVFMFPRFERGSNPNDADAALVIDTANSRSNGTLLIRPTASGTYPVAFDIVSARDTFITFPNVGAATISVRTGGNARNTEILMPHGNPTFRPVSFGGLGERIIGDFGREGLTATDFTPSAGWGNSASVSSVNGRDDGVSFCVDSAGTGQGADPTITLTFKGSRATGGGPEVIVVRRDGDQMTVPLSWTTSDTAIVITFNGTPVAGQSYDFTLLTSA